MARELWRDVGFGLRLMARRPGHTAVAVISLVLGIGMNVAVFTLLDAIFLRPLPVEDPDSLAVVYVARRADSGEYTGTYIHSAANYRDLSDRSRSFTELAAYHWWPMNFTGGSEPLRATGMFVSANYFDTLGLEPALGRFFRAEEDETPGTHPVVVLSHGSWTRLFGADPGILERTVRVNGKPFGVVGVAPDGFRGTEVTVAVDFWLPIATFPEISPLAQWFESRGVSFFNVFGRLREGVSRATAETELLAISRQLEDAFPKENEGLGARVRPFLEATFGIEGRDRHLDHGKLLAGAVALVLLIACLNVAHLLLVRGIERGRELALRQSLGASRARVALQLTVENLALFLVGGLLSLPIAQLALELLWRFRPPQFPAERFDLALDVRVLAFALGLALVCGLLFGVLPALRAARVDLVSQLKETAAPISRRHGWRWLDLRRVVVALQVALTLTGLVGAGLFVRSMQNAYDLDLGFDADALAVVTLAPGDQGYEEERVRALYRRALERARALPGVRSAALSENRLLRGAVMRRQIFLDGEDQALVGHGRDFHRVNAVYPGFFSTVGIPLVRGGDFPPGLDGDRPLQAIVNQTLAEAAWPGEDPIGQRFRFDYPSEPPVEVVGVAADARYRHVHEAPQFFIYLSAEQTPPSVATLHVRAAGDPRSLVEPLRREMRAVDPDVPLADARELRGFVIDDLWRERASAALAAVFGVLALILAAVGIYGILSYTVSRQRREIGIRKAIGARRGHLLAWLLAEAALLVAAGLVLGLALTLALVKLATAVSSQLVEISPTDPWIYLLAVLVMVVIALLGSLLPARKAVAVDPALTLREP